MSENNLDNNSENNLDFKKAAMYFFLALIFVISAVFLSSLVSKKQEPITILLPTPINCPNDLDAFTETTKKVVLIQDKNSNGSDKELKGYKVILERKGLTSDIACGYLRYQVSFNNKPIEQNYMSLYMQPTSSQFGGHILPNEKSGAIIREINNKTDILMPLDKITYDGLDREIIKEANWTSLLNIADTIEFEIALSADIPSGKLDLVEFAYKCMNKETGRETEDCNLSVSNIAPFGF